MNVFQATMLAVAMALPAGAVTEFSRYAPILERRPFSSPVAEDAEPPPPVTAIVPPAFVQDLRMVAITESHAGVRVGVVNTRETPPKTYFLYVGDSEDGILLAEADYNAARALLRKDGEQFWITMGTSDTPAAAPPETGMASPPPGGQAQPVAGPVEAEVANSGNPAASYAERRRQRLDIMRQRAQESRNLSEEDVEKRLREYQMKQIREGKTPLPIPITEEMDAQLVKEGILPPVE